MWNVACHLEGSRPYKTAENAFTKRVELNLRHRETCAKHAQHHNTRRDYCHPQFVKRLGLEATLEGHNGCVNCIQWNEEGSVLASGSDDHNVILWDARAHRLLTKIHTGHSNNIFSVQFIPRTRDRMLVSAAGDAKVRMHNVDGRQGDQCMQVYACHSARVKRLAINQAEPHLVWSAGEDGMVMEWDIREPVTCAAKGQCCHVLVNLCAHAGSAAEVKCVASNPCRSEQLAVGATDEFARVYDRRMLTRQIINITDEYNRYRNLWSIPSSSDGFTDNNYWMVKSESYDHPPSAANYYAAGHLPLQPSLSSRRGHSLTTTNLTFSPDGNELLVNLGGEQIYLFPVVQGAAGSRPIRTLSAVSEMVLAAAADCERDALQLHNSEPTSSKRSRQHTSNGHTTNGYHANGFTAHGSSSARRGSGSGEPQLSARVERLKRRANECFERKAYSAAIALYSEALLLAPHAPVLYANRAAAYSKRGWGGDVYAALRDCHSVLRSHPDHVKAWFRLARCFHELQLPHLAWQTLLVFKQRFPDEYSNDTCARLLLDVKSSMFEQKHATEGAAARNGTHRNGRRPGGTVSESDNTDAAAAARLVASLAGEGSAAADDTGDTTASSSGDEQSLGVGALSETEQTLQSQAVDYAQRFCGHCNTTTDIKEANFFGDRSDFIVAGSDDGSFFVWSRATCNIVAILRGDESIVNCLQPHPTTCQLATSGIESVVKLWSPRPEDGSPNAHLVSDFEQSAAANQRRMHADPIEAMLLNIGNRMGGADAVDGEAMPRVLCRQS